MALLGKKPSGKPAPKKAPPAKRGSKVASIADVNAATSAIEEEPGTDSPQALQTRQAPAPKLTGDKDAAYRGFSTQTYSETASKQRLTEAISGEVDEFAVSHEVGVVYVDESQREFYFDEYGTKHFADEVAPSPEIPESFEDARHSSSREKFQKEAEVARQTSDAVRVPSAEQQPNPYQGGAPAGYPAPQYPAPYPAPGSPQQEYGYAPSAPVGYPAPQYGGAPINHGEGVPVINIANAPHIENPFLEGSHEINRQIEQGVVAENFPAIATTIASLVNSSKSSDEITRTLLGYIQTTLAGEGPDATMKLLGTDNIYAPLLVSALALNLMQTPIQPVALREVWDVKPEIKVEEKIVYVKDSSAPRNGEKGFWVSTEGVDESAAASPIYQSMTEQFAERGNRSGEPNYANLDYS